MPIRYRVDAERGLVETIVEGMLTADDLRNHAVTLAADVTRKPGMNEIVDLSSAEGADVPAEAIGGMASYLREHDHNTPGTRLALAAPSDAAFGMARMYQAYREHPAFEICVFRSREEALRWLGIEP